MHNAWTTRWSARTIKLLHVWLLVGLGWMSVLEVCGGTKSERHRHLPLLLRRHFSTVEDVSVSLRQRLLPAWSLANVLVSHIV